MLLSAVEAAWNACFFLSGLEMEGPPLHWLTTSALASMVACNLSTKNYVFLITFHLLDSWASEEGTWRHHQISCCQVENPLALPFSWQARGRKLLSSTTASTQQHMVQLRVKRLRRKSQKRKLNPPRKTRNYLFVEPSCIYCARATWQSAERMLAAANPHREFLSTKLSGLSGAGGVQRTPNTMFALS